jgi:hypothetical protein
MKRLMATAAVVGLCGAASADVNTRIDVLVSSDGVNFSDQVLASPGETVQVLISVSYIGTALPLGLASMVFQPTVSNFHPTYTPLPFVNGGAGGNTTNPPGVAVDFPDQYGRITPWARTAMTTSTAITNFNNNSVGQPIGDWLRIAQRQVTAWIGGAGNTTGGSGVNIAQLANVGRTASDPAFNPALTNIHVFRFGFTLDSLNNFEFMTVDLPANGFGNRNSTTGDREVFWWGDLNEASGSIRGTAEVHVGRVVIPAPASAALLVLAGAGISRRRRR